MTKKKRTRRALINSVISLLICFSMLLGTTFAWFTDSVSSVNNKIVAGNLDVELEYYDATAKEWKAVTSETNLFSKELWEPGHTQVAYLKVRNAGTLALKYQLGVNIVSETGAKNVNGVDFKLSDHIEFGVIETKNENIYANRDAARAAVTTSKIISEGYTKSQTEGLYPEGKGLSEEYVTLVVFMPEEVGNEANYRGTAPEIYLGVNLMATQLVYENDSFGPDYDEDAAYLEPWSGNVDTDWYFEDQDAETFTIDTAEELAGLAAIVNGTAVAETVTYSASEEATVSDNFSGHVVMLGANINLGNLNWTPIGPNADAENKFKGTFDGQGYTIYNLKVEQEAAYRAAGLFGALNGTVKNLKIDGATINSISSGDATDNGIAVVAGSLYNVGYVDNVHVTDATVNGNRYVGGISGYTYGSVTNSSVTNSTLTATPNEIADGKYDNGDKVGGIAGYYASESVYEITGNTVANVTLKGFRHIGGIAGYGDATVKNNTVSNVKIIVDTTTNAYESSSAGAWGEIIGNGNNPDGNNSSNVAPLVGTEVAAGVIKTDAKKYCVTSKEGLINLESVLTAAVPSEANELTVDLMCNVDLSGETWDPIDNMWVTFNGNGYTISNMTTDSVRKAGFFGYAGAVTINNLTIENATVTGSQAGVFAGSGEGFKANNCVLKGTNVVNFAETEETWNGIGAITGVLQNSTVNVTIEEDAVVNVHKDDMTTVEGCVYVDDLTGYITANKGTVINNGTVNVYMNQTVTGNVAPMTFANGTLTLKDVTIDGTEAVKNALTITGDAEVIVVGNVVLTGAKGGSGIYVAEGGELTISGTGSLEATGNVKSEYEAGRNYSNSTDTTLEGTGGSGIGGTDATIVINGLTNLVAEGYGKHAFGIGGNGSTVTIKGTTIKSARGGFVNVTGEYNDAKYNSSEPEGGAAIGGAVIKIENSHIESAIGGSKAAGIGAQYWQPTDITITNTTIDKVVGGASSAGIGGSRVDDADIDQDVLINIVNSKITAVGGYYGAGIGSGYDTHCQTPDKAPMHTIYIKDNSVINATGGKYAAGIGTGYHVANLDGEIETTVTVNAVSGEKFYKDTYTQAQNIGFGVTDPTREGLNNTCTFKYNGVENSIPSVTAAN